MAKLAEVDSIEIRVLVNDQLDNITPSWHPDVKARGRFSHIPLGKLDASQSEARGNAKLEMDFASSCCGAHGLSLLITTTRGETKRTLLFDAGPEGFIWKTNVERLKLTEVVGQVEMITLSHWHRDHSGGLEEAVRMISEAKNPDQEPVRLSLHPSRPYFRGIMSPMGPLTLLADPTFQQLEEAGAVVSLDDQDHIVLDDTFFISGEIPRTTSYETGFANGIRLNSSPGEWEKDELMLDERFVMCNLKGKGLVVFTGCGHAGVVNTARYAAQVGEGVPLFTVVGGFHLSDSDVEKLQKTVADLMELKPKVLMPGHCTGWRFSVEAEKSVSGSVVPLYGGQIYNI